MQSFRCFSALQCPEIRVLFHHYMIALHARRCFVGKQNVVCVGTQPNFGLGCFFLQVGYGLPVIYSIFGSREVHDEVWNGRLHFVVDTVEVFGVRPMLENTWAVHLWVSFDGLYLESALVLDAWVSYICQFLNKFVDSRFQTNRIRATKLHLLVRFTNWMVLLH